MADSQWPHPWPYTEHCTWHDAHEPAEGAYRLCLECGHAFRTAEELQTTYVDNAPAETRSLAAGLVPASEISFCPHCLHDF